MALYGPLYVTISGLNTLQNHHYTIELEEIINHDTDESAIAVYFEEYMEYEEAEDLLINSGGLSDMILDQEEEEEEYDWLDEEADENK